MSQLSSKTMSPTLRWMESMLNSPYGIQLVRKIMIAYVRCHTQTRMLS